MWGYSKHDDALMEHLHSGYHKQVIENLCVAETES
jgi:hypothetical protein